ncbi:MAG: copper chaperone PCu(A)C [Hyphomicrobiaceae bacterium]
MKRTLLLLALALIGLASPALAHEYKLGALTLHHPWARATPPGAQVAGAYVEIVNAGTEPDRLIAVSSPVAEVGEIHEMSMVEDVMKMRRLEAGLEIPAGATVSLKPGSFHIMLMKLKEPLVENVPVKATLTFENAGAIEVELVVEKIGAMSSDDN